MEAATPKARRRGRDAPAPDPIAEGFACLARNDWDGTRRWLSVIDVATAGPQVRLGLALACFCSGDWEASRVHMEAAYSGFRVAGEHLSAAQAATFLGYLYFSQLGDMPASAGWLRRARRLCAEVGDCVEQGYVELAYAACDVANAGRLERCARRALEIARQFSDVDLEMRALADLGLACVTQGRLVDGLAMLDEAMTAGINGEVTFVNAGFIACSMISACLRAGDIERAESWLRRVDEVLAPQPAPLYTHCRISHGSALTLTGRMAEAEEQILRAVESCRTTSLVQRAHAAAALADLRIRQGRLDDAEEALRGLEDRFEAVLPAAELALARGDHTGALAIARRGRREMGPDRLRGAELLDVQVRAMLDAGDVAGAGRAARQLADWATALESDELQSTAIVASARVAHHRGDASAVELLEEALRLLAPLQRPLLTARLRLELAEALSRSSPAAAATELKSAMAAFERLGARTEIVRAMRLLDRIADAPDAAAHAATPRLSDRESEVARLVGDGMRNREIAQRLFLSVRTVESHVARVLGKLQLDSRTQLATAVRDGLALGSDANRR